MSSHVLTSVLDTKADCFSTPVAVRTEAEAIRSFSQSVNNPETGYHNYPEDFILFSVGTFDQLTGEIVPHPAKELVKAISVKEADEIPYADLTEAKPAKV